MEQTAHYLTDKEIERIETARRKAEKHCVDEVSMRYAWEMARLLTSWQLSADVIVAAFLFPLVYHSIFTNDVLEDQFGRRATDLAYGLSKALQDTQNSQIQHNDDKSRSIREFYTQTLRKLFITAYVNVEIIFLIIAHRLASVRDNEELEHGARLAWAQENIAVYLPIMELLGIWVPRRDLGNLSLSISNPEFYKQLTKQVQVTHNQHKRLFQHIADRLSDVLEKQSVAKALIQLHDNNPLSMSQRIERSRRRGRKYNPDKASVMTVDVMVETVRDCYHTLGIIHKCWKPAHRQREFDNGRFVDYIASPRYNGYRCIITTVLVKDATDDDTRESSESLPTRLVEFRIRTQKMEHINTIGIIGAMHYNETIRNAWWEDQGAARYIKAGRTDTLRAKQEFAVFTPTGEVMYPFDKGSTVIDVAFRVHTQLGPYARRAYVNGRSVPFKQPIYHRDIVEIEFDLEFASIEASWEEHAKTALARKEIRKFIRAMSYAPHKGRRILDEILEREMNIYQMRFPKEKIEDHLQTIAQQNRCQTIEALYVKVLKNEIEPDEIVASLIESELVGHIVQTDGSPPPFKINIARSWFQEKGAKKFDRSSRIIPGCEIVGRIAGKGNYQRIVVHRADSHLAPTRDQAIRLMWTPTNTPREVAEITVTAQPKTWVLSMVANALAGIGDEDESKQVILQKFNSEMRDGSLNIEMLIDAPSITQLDEAQAKLTTMERSGYISGFKVWQLFPGQKILMASRSDKRVQNPFTLRHVRDQSMFFGRATEIARILDYIQDDQTFIVLYGQQRIGKTSLLYQLSEHLIPQACDVVPVQFDVQSLYPFNARTFLEGLAGATIQKLSQRHKRLDGRRALNLRKRDFDESPYRAFADWVRKIEEQLQGSRVLFVVDEFTRAEEAAKKGDIDMDFFHGLQYLAGNANIGFLLCLHDHIYKETSIGWSVYQRGQPVRLLHLDRAPAAQLIRHPLSRLYKFDDALVEKILDLTDCHPYFIQAICQALITDMAQKEHEHITDDDLRRAVNRFLNEGHHYFRHYESQVDAKAWQILRVIAFGTTDDEPWISSEIIRDIVRQHNMNFESWQISKSIGDLKQAGLINARNHAGQAQYGIPVSVFRTWLHDKVTDLLVSQDINIKG